MVDLDQPFSAGNPRRTGCSSASRHLYQGTDRRLQVKALVAAQQLPALPQGSDRDEEGAHDLAA